MANRVKGVWFVTARRYLDEREPDVVARMLARMPPEHASAFREPAASAWYPEEALACTLRLLREETRTFRDERFAELMETMTLVGLSRFFRTVLGLSSLPFVLRRIPEMWKLIRRGEGRVNVETSAHGATIRYTQFPWFVDPNYPLLTLGSIRALVSASRASADVRVAHTADDALTVEVTYR